jgi:hypothetical protein
MLAWFILLLMFGHNGQARTARSVGLNDSGDQHVAPAASIGNVYSIAATTSRPFLTSSGRTP